jgi:hypothetical protein
MSYSDEPEVLVARTSRPWLWIAVPLVLLLVGGIFAAAVAGPLHERRKLRAERGAHQGIPEVVRVEGVRTRLEVGRQADGRLCFALDPLPTNPERVTISYVILNVDREEFRVPRRVAFNPQTQTWDAERDQFFPEMDVRLQLRIERGNELLLKQRVWGYGIP